jgi:hypothetical protein
MECVSRCLVFQSTFWKVDQTLNLLEHLRKMVDDERGPYGCDEVSRELTYV